MTLIYNDDQRAGNSRQAASYFLCETFPVPPLLTVSLPLLSAGFPSSSVSKESSCSAADRGSSLGQEDSLEKEMATHSSILAQRIPWTEEPGGLQSMGWQRVGHD
ncbi:unnamed protein product [Rangifer tarandus platyrhynchus]|uniref:Uncharacterized protein n=2 Tax=Rangifer tarandus platyrhynchus TaxID=3082113 RepID=A0ABN8XUR6_RANTA|nr:unnamed protein product [Rangifer tarandus platyrhynchus]